MPETGFENPIPQAGDVVKEQLIGQASKELLLSTYAAVTETTVSGAIASARTFNPTEDNIRVAHYGVQSTLALATATAQAKTSLAYTPFRSLVIDAAASDGMPDSFETKHGFNLNLADASGDADADGLSNLAEYLIGTDPRKRDSDGDTFADGDEVDRGSSPLDSLSTPQTAVPVRGDPNTDARVDVADVAFLLRYLSGKGPAPSPLFAGDANSDGRIDIVDAVLLLKRVREK